MYQLISLIPKDYNIINFAPSFTDYIVDFNKFYQLFSQGNYYINAQNGFWGTIATAFSKDAINALIKMIEHEFLPIDNYLFENTNNNINFGKCNHQIDYHYISTFPLSYLTYDESSNNISNEIDLYQYYIKYVNKNMYYMYE
jgi:hypothetical protein